VTADDQGLRLDKCLAAPRTEPGLPMHSFSASQR
jgi:hypothetical protein